ncbi:MULTISPECIES: hypothetical protein [unclassified Streptomyces]|uniref:hypothetical protein n=1 Tax=unclassified Streptomyces TaxID=2593676 RepID=UPI000DC76EB4|nr:MULTISPECIES: hypothetical protein [unclassified Streptomyces]AWZ05926.1 hypothetical protein DRB89_16225 [Streptomyces sp. ICC4]AWZ12959.1 hypothetical protein DRB96_12185 [Streptomyces sp. ICC1]
MNLALTAQQEALGELKKREKSIDEARRRVADLRYDLEAARQSSVPKPATDTAQAEQDYADASKTALGAMSAFNGDQGIGGILRGISVAHHQFSAQEADALKNLG